jgi:hypothetical protein
MGEVQKPSDSECYTPSSEPFRFYSFACLVNQSDTNVVVQATRDQKWDDCKSKHASNRYNIRVENADGR